ncbi:MAG TPA: PD-(D/E)XK nuclease family transposase [Parapedobacter sp.]|nr:PD-(D/E)XK nuclease family transposase [Parapedobacter sp.]HWK57405.1 PD-(D/E)XK nuclease family transposase [Parapedobacter sp.]
MVYNKLGFKFLELPNFAKEEGDLLTDTDKWMYLLKHMSTLDKVPTFLDKRVFQLIFKISEVAKLRKEERMAYEASLKAKWDTQNAFNAVRREAREAGKEEAGFQFVKNLLFNTDFDDVKIAELASVSLSFVQKVKAELKVK